MQQKQTVEYISAERSARCCSSGWTLLGPSQVLLLCLVWYQPSICASVDNVVHVFHILLSKRAGFPNFSDASYDLVFVGSSFIPAMFRENNFIFLDVFVLDRREGRRRNQDPPKCSSFSIRFLFFSQTKLPLVETEIQALHEPSSTSETKRMKRENWKEKPVINLKSLFLIENS